MVILANKIIHQSEFQEFFTFQTRLAISIETPENHKKDWIFVFFCREVQTQAILFLKSMSEKVGSDIERL